MQLNPKIFLGLTTTGLATTNKSSWQTKIEEIKKFDIEEIALFTTALDPEKRQDLYELLKDSPVKKIPFVHLRHDSSEEEIIYLINNYGTKLFNIHASPDTLENYKNFSIDKKMIFVENTDHLTDAFWPAVKEYGGVCLDFAHYEDYGKRQKDPTYENFEDELKSFKVGFAHISGVQDEKYTRHDSYFSFYDDHYSVHFLKKLSDLDYLKNYRHLFPEISAIELENSLEEQLKIKEYIEREIL